MMPPNCSNAAANLSSTNALTVGDCRITCVRAGSYWWDGGAMFGVVPKTLWSKHQASDELNRIEASFNCFIVQDGCQRILIETGGGVRHDARSLARMRMQQGVHAHEALAEAGFGPETIDTVINTHLHWDHCGGNTVDSGHTAVAAFPNARYVTQRGELTHAREQNPRDAVSYRAVNYEPLIESGRLHLLDGDADISPVIRVQVMPGHNRDMMVVLVRSGGETWCHFADHRAVCRARGADMGRSVRPVSARNDRIEECLVFPGALRRKAGGAVSATTRRLRLAGCGSATASIQLRVNFRKPC